MTGEARRGPRFRAALAAVVAAAFAIRFGARLALGEAAFWRDGYAIYPMLADALRAGQGYALPGSGPTAGRLPLYPLMLAALGGSGGSFVLIAAVQAAISATTVALAGLLARDRWGTSAGLAAALLAAIYPYAVVHDTALQESGLFACLAAAATFLLWRLDRPEAPLRTAALAGLLLGIGILTRATLLPFALLAVGWIAWRRREPRHAVIVVAALLATVSPWLAWNHHVTGQVALSSDTGRLLWAGNNPDTFAAYPSGSIDRSQEIAFARLSPDERARLFTLDESVRSARLAARAVEFARDNPARVAEGAARKLAAAFGPLPSPRMGGWETALYLAGWLPVLALGLAGLWLGRRDWRRDALIHAHFAGFAAVAAVFWAHTSHRAYLDIYLIVFAAPLVVRVARRALG